MPKLEEPVLEFDDLLKYLNEFDMKDIPSDFRYSSSQEQRLPLNMLNNFKHRNITKSDESKEIELVSKLEQPTGKAGYASEPRFRLSSYTITPQGVHLHKGEELGMF